MKDVGVGLHVLILRMQSLEGEGIIERVIYKQLIRFLTIFLNIFGQSRFYNVILGILYLHLTSIVR